MLLISSRSSGESSRTSLSKIKQRKTKGGRSPLASPVCPWTATATGSSTPRTPALVPGQEPMELGRGTGLQATPRAAGRRRPILPEPGGKGACKTGSWLCLPACEPHTHTHRPQVPEAFFLPPRRCQASCPFSLPLGDGLRGRAELPRLLQSRPARRGFLA